jgi:predicted nucleotidyltransferase component of viral defense system
MAVTDKGASVIARLKNKVKETGKPFHLYLQLFCQEEFLRKLSLSPYADNLILKGGLFIYELTHFQSRATIDVDFLLQYAPGDVEGIKEIVETIIHIDTGNDFIVLEAAGYEMITPERKYKGVSFQIIGHIKNTRTPFNVDIGVGDVISPSPEKRTIPGQLDGFIEPVITTYSLESTIAEKLDAMLQRLELTSRMKDFYDIYYLAHTFDFEGRRLKEAITKTLMNRDTLYSADSLDAIMDLVNDVDIQTRWNYFIRRLKLPELGFAEVLHGMDVFLRPVWITITGQTECSQHWSAEQYCWE